MLIENLRCLAAKLQSKPWAKIILFCLHYYFLNNQTIFIPHQSPSQLPHLSRPLAFQNHHKLQIPRQQSVQGCRYSLNTRSVTTPKQALIRKSRCFSYTCKPRLHANSGMVIVAEVFSRSIFQSSGMRSTLSKRVVVLWLRHLYLLRKKISLLPLRVYCVKPPIVPVY